MNDTVCHLTGSAVNLCGRIIQRCSICGEKLLDITIEEIQASKKASGYDGDPDEVCYYEPGMWLRIMDDGYWEMITIPPKHIPKDCCIVLVER